MSVSRIAGRYAKSLIELASEQGSLDAVTRDVEYFKAVSDVRPFYLMIKSPIIKGSKKQQVFHVLFDEHFDKITLAFLDILTRKGREKYLPEIAAEFVRQYRELKEISIVRLTTASPLSEATVDTIHSNLTSSSATHKNVEIEHKVDPELIGGFVLEFEDKLYNASVAHKLDQLKKEFSDNRYLRK